MQRKDRKKCNSTKPCKMYDLTGLYRLIWQCYLFAQLEDPGNIEAIPDIPLTP